MNKLNSLSAELSATDQQFCDNLLALAEWLDSQKEHCQVYHSPLKQQGIVIHPAWEQTMSYSPGEEKYYNSHVTNRDRVLAVLLLRSAILAGDSFI